MFCHFSPKGFIRLAEGFNPALRLGTLRQAQGKPYLILIPKEILDFAQDKEEREAAHTKPEIVRFTPLRPLYVQRLELSEPSASSMVLHAQSRSFQHPILPIAE